MKILVINGPNLNILGKRDEAKYGKISWEKIAIQLKKIANNSNCTINFFQSNCEGKIIDFLQSKKADNADGVLVNPGALTRYGYSLRQALVDFNKPFIEIHMSEIDKTGIHRHLNVFEDIRLMQISGLKEKSYYKGLIKLINYLK